MSFKSIDDVVNNILTKEFGKKSERIDYRQLELKDPKKFKGYGDKNGLTFLVDVDYDHYLYVNLYEKRDSARIVFRRDDTNIIHKYVPLITLEKYLKDTLSLIGEYQSMMYKMSKFNSSEVTIDIIRDSKIKEILK